MSDALPLPPRPNIEQYKKLAKDLQHACKSSDPGAIRDWAVRWVEAIARLQGPEITPEVRREIEFQAEWIEQRWRKLRKTHERAARCTLADAQFFVARGHGFASWPTFAKHIQALASANSPVSTFEAAVERRLLRQRCLASLLGADYSMRHVRCYPHLVADRTG
jgi:hypothetical protein